MFYLCLSRVPRRRRRRKKKQSCRNCQANGLRLEHGEKAVGSPKQLGFVWKQLWLDVWFSWKPHDREVMRETAGPALCAISPHSFATTLLKFPSPTFITGPPGTPALTVREADALSPTTSASYLSRNVCFQLHVNNFLNTKQCDCNVTI